MVRLYRSCDLGRALGPGRAGPAAEQPLRRMAAGMMLVRRRGPALGYALKLALWHSAQGSMCPCMCICTCARMGSVCVSDSLGDIVERNVSMPLVLTDVFDTARAYSQADGSQHV